ncbi:MAG: hypothetical protein V1873_04425 [Verrucomicrobiota bacterium]
MAIPPSLRLSMPALSLLVVCLGLFLAFMGLLPMLTAAGAFPALESGLRTPRWVVFLPGLVIFMLGIEVLRAAAEAIVNDFDASARRPFAFRLVRCAASRVTRKTLLAGGAYALVAAQCFVAWRFDYVFPSGRGRALIPIMLVEFLVIHSSAFLGLVALIPPEGALKKVKAGCFAAFFLVYAGMAIKYADVASALFFVYLTGAKFLGYRLNPPKLQERWIIGLRWFVYFLVFMGAGAFFERSFTSRDNLPFGLLYFSILALLELFDFFNVSFQGPLEIAGQKLDLRQLTQGGSKPPS